MMDPKLLRFYSKISAAVFLKVVLVGTGAWLGFLLDKRFHTYPWLLMLLLVVTAAIGIWWIVYVATHANGE